MVKIMVVEVKKVDDKDLWKILKREGFIYLGNRVMAKLVYGNNVDAYKEYITAIVGDYGDADIKILEG